MTEIEKINSDFSLLFEEGRKLLEDGVGEILNGCRDKAFAEFKELGGVPCRTEDYVYVDFVPSFSKDYQTPLKYIPQDIDVEKEFKCTVADMDTRLILMVNGWYYEGNSVSGLPDGVVVCSLREAEKRYRNLMAEHYNKYTVDAKKDALVALNTAFAQDGFFVYVPDNVVLEQPLQVVNILHAQNNLMAFQRNLIILGRNAKATVLVCDHALSEVDFLMNNVTEAVLSDGADLDYNQVQKQHIHTYLINSIFISEHRNSVFDGTLITLYGGLIRNNFYATLNNEGGNCTLKGVYILDKKQCVDNYSRIDHRASHCCSNEYFKGVLDDMSLANFMGCVLVRLGAQKTESYQANNNLLLTDTARINTRPQLVIDANDVKCSHGATVGQIDEEAMFYLRSRGISAEEAKLMLMLGFAHDIVGKIKLEPLRDEIDRLIDKRFRGELSKCENCILHCKKV